MYRILVPTEKDIYELSELAKMFVPASDFVMEEKSSEGIADLEVFPGTKNQMKQQVYAFFKEKTGITPDWGILIGVKPEKLYHQLENEFGRTEAERKLSEEYFVLPEKLSLLREIANVQKASRQSDDPNAVGVYIGIPFCPSRCLYCSFTSNTYKKEAADKYTEALLKEISAVKKIMAKRKLFAESIYIGGGTPTSLDDENFEKLMKAVSSELLGKECTEFTVESGRPDTITREKLDLISKYGGNRISINPQTMKAHTLELIGRAHSPQQILDAFKLAKNSDIKVINTDLIAGLPEESPEDFKNSLDTMIALGPQNITVHTLAVKRASRLIDEDPTLGIRQAENVRKMLEYASSALNKAGYSPYYMYRQKHMSGNFENTGYCLKGTQSVYNIRIMEENQSIIAMGAGGISKLYFPMENRIERIANVSNYQIYIERIDEMIQRKENGIL